MLRHWLLFYSLAKTKWWIKLLQAFVYISVYISFQFILVNIKEPWIMYYDLFCEKLPHCLLKWWHHFSFSSAINTRDHGSHTHQYWISVSILDSGHTNRWIMVSHCFNLQSLMTFNVEHLSIALLAICISLVRCLLRSFVYFVMELLFYCWVWVSHTILDIIPLSAMC
jgi:hypothetical protein